MEYNKKHCNIKGCKHAIYRNYLCKTHYDFYLSDENCKKISDEVIAVYENRGTWKQRFLSVRDSFIHHALDYPMVRYEHFPLEHIYLLALQRFDKKDRERCMQVLADFDIPENENIPMLKRVTDKWNIGETEVKPIGHYLFTKRELLSIVPILISIVGFVAVYLLLRLANNETEDWFGMTRTRILDTYRQIAPYVALLILAVWNGTRLASFYNYLANRAYNLNLFDDVESNINILNQIEYVKERNKRADSYRYTVFGSLLGVSALTLYHYFSSTTFCMVSFGLLLCSLMVFIPLLYVYNMTVLYFPVFEGLKHKRLKIDLYNPDHCGGLNQIHNFLFRTFVYNEGLVLVTIALCTILGKFELLILAAVLLAPRMNHALWSARLYCSSLINFSKTKREERERLLTQDSVNAFFKIERLDNLSTNKIYKYVANIFCIVIIPYIINHLDGILEHIAENAPIIWNWLMIK